VLHAQPIVDLRTLETVQHELLLRMLDPEEGLIPPGRFLPVAEAFGLSTEIDRWVLHQAIGLAAGGHAVELNLSAHSLDDASLPHRVERLLEASGADPALLVFEVTETALVANQTAARHFADRIHELGCKLALDDFGTGYGGFTYLKHLPVDFLKIDREFIRDLGDSTASRHVVEAVVRLARGFGIETVAEGVEDGHTLRLLQELEVDHAQGFHLGRPGPLHERVPPP
jgi:EAL domain-containing protein (putative c-di-GMP-specific phosphodiesterase class I)